MNPVGAITRARDRAVGTWRGFPPLTQDTVLAALAAAVPVALVLAQDRGLDGWRRLLWLLLVLSACAPLILRRRLPLVVAAVCALASAGAAVVSGRDSLFLVVAAAVGSAGYHADGRRVVLTAGAITWTVAFGLLGGAGSDIAMLASLVALGGAPVAFGYALRLQAERGANLARLERARAETARSQERARIARDVHDVVGHHLSAIRLQAVGGRRGLGDENPEAERVFTTIADLSQRALGDIRHFLDRLRHEPTAAELSGLADLPELAARLGGDGMRIDLTAELDLDDVAPGVQSCVYRVAQESLTNVVRHSRATTASVRLDREDDRLVLVVQDAGPPRRGAGLQAGEPHRASGLCGMRERVELLGGTFRAAPHGVCGWQVRAVLPLVPDGAP